MRESLMLFVVFRLIRVRTFFAISYERRTDIVWCANIQSEHTHAHRYAVNTHSFSFSSIFFSRSRTGLLLVPMLICVEGALVICVCASACGVRSRTVNEKECLLLLLHNIKCSANSTYQSCEKHSPQGF